MKKEYIKIIMGVIIAIIIAQVAGIIGSFSTFEAIPTWYATLVKPSFNPPNWIFGPVWTLLYTMMGVASYLVWRKRHDRGAKGALVLYFIHLLVNAVWSIVFFGQQNPTLALGVIIILWLMIVTMIFWFKKYYKLAY